jgi:hypothetical protein
MVLGIEDGQEELMHASGRMERASGCRVSKEGWRGLEMLWLYLESSGDETVADRRHLQR